ncbi:MAG: hypothetical protein JST40_07245 [Armatimonadetes bacterium]|nr:hypothetical protein [Armatimonadota bacterium]
MATQAVNTLDTGAYFGNTAVKKKSSSLDMQDFLQLIVTQLTNQNPLEPVSDSEYYAQLAQMGTVQGIDELKTSMQNTESNSLMGKQITALRNTSDGGVGTDLTVSGVVVGSIVKDGTRYLKVQDSKGGIAEVELANVQTVSDVDKTDPTVTAVQLAGASGLIGKTIQAPHPSLKNSDGTAEALSGTVKKVSYDKGQIYLTVTDRLGNDVKVNLFSVESFN